MKRLALPTILLAAGALLASGCVYKMNIQQGNYLVPDSVSQLKEGMTRSQVRFLLGTPMVPDAFDESRWDYYYYFNSQKFEEPLKRRLTVYFADDKVARFENIGVPTQADLDQLERDLRKAVAETQGKEKNPLKRMFGRDKPAATESAAESPSAPASAPATPSEAEQTPDPVPPSEPAPAPAGTPSGPT
ncbi:MAG TPA: outer membrane protein assembly factor BamE [Steroidobacteraceae bacterium]|nr:outer membrane protein assembly factor BamE [Steroidobacteraceae bacterium]